MKRCEACHKTKSLDQFKRNRKTPDGRTYLCIECLRARRLPPQSGLTADDRRERNLARIRERLATDQNYRERQHASRRRAMYGLTPQQHDALLEAQSGTCAICKQPPTATKGRGSLHVEHCRATETIRGLACFHCNTGLGHFNHDPALLRAAAEYLENPPARIKRRIPQPRSNAKCGTMGGYNRHRYLGQPICEACYEAKREYEAKMRAERAAGREPKRRVVAVCGTPGGYAKHYRLGEKPCDACKQAMAEYNAGRHRKKTSP